MYYIYAYLRLDGTPYYIGKGRGKRAYKPHIRKRSRRIGLPSPDRIKILDYFEKEEDAFNEEMRLIKHYGRKDKGNGILRNLTWGGEGGSQYLTEEEAREAKSKTDKRYKELNKEKLLEYAKKYNELNKEKKREQNRKWREENKERKAEYRRANKEKTSEYNKKYRELNKEKISEYNKKWRELNKEKKVEYDKKYRELNKENISERNKKYYELNKEKKAEYDKKYRELNEE